MATNVLVIGLELTYQSISHHPLDIVDDTCKEMNRVIEMKRNELSVHVANIYSILAFVHLKINQVDSDGQIRTHCHHTIPEHCSPSPKYP